MTEYGYRVYEYIVDATNSDLILFFVIIAVIVVPLYIVVLKGRKTDKQHELKREKQILEVIKENSTVIAGLKVTLDTSNVDTKSTLDRIHTRIDGICTGIARINTNIDNSIVNQAEIASKTNKILLIVNKGEN